MTGFLPRRRYGGRVLRRIEKYQLVADVTVALLFFLIFLVIASADGFAGLLVLFGFSAAIFFRRLAPGVALTVVWFAALAQMFAGLTVQPYDVAVLAVLYATSAYGSRVVKWLGLASAGLGGLVAAIYLIARQLFPSGGGSAVEVLLSFVFLLVASWAVLGIAWTVGQLVRTRSAAADSRRAQTLAEIEQERALESVAIEQERNRIARDMHDVVAHSLAVVIAQADGARYAKSVDPDAVDEALRTISSTAREALGDVRVLLGQLRHSEGAAPAPELQDLDKLFDQLRGAGLTVVFRQNDDSRQLGTGQQLAVYRIVQEALTNALRHGDIEQPVHVLLHWQPDAVTVSVVNSLRPEVRVTGPVALPSPGSPVAQGHGIAGMRERALLAAGTFDAGRLDGTWVVTARIPQTTSTRAIPVQELFS